MDLLCLSVGGQNISWLAIYCTLSMGGTLGHSSSIYVSEEQFKIRVKIKSSFPQLVYLNSCLWFNSLSMEIELQELSIKIINKSLKLNLQLQRLKDMHKL